MKLANLIPKFMCKNKKLRITETIMKNKEGRHTLTDVKIYCKIIVTKAM